ncbi:MAG: class I SAM-dependent methyltransferase, partial [Betaproteobacteria bacterium]
MSTAQGESMTKGTPLASAFAEAGGVQRVFDGKAHDYERARPGYPAALYEHIESLVGRGAVLSIADIGAGTGLFTRGWLDRGHRVVAVEPNDPMREAADALLRGQPRYRSTNGSAEATAVADASVDLVTAAQAFHWFDALAFRAESL